MCHHAWWPWLSQSVGWVQSLWWNCNLSGITLSTGDYCSLSWLWLGKRHTYPTYPTVYLGIYPVSETILYLFIHQPFLQIHLLCTSTYNPYFSMRLFSGRLGKSLCWDMIYLYSSISLGSREFLLLGFFWTLGWVPTSSSKGVVVVIHGSRQIRDFSSGLKWNNGSDIHLVIRLWQASASSSVNEMSKHRTELKGQKQKQMV